MGVTRYKIGKVAKESVCPYCKEAVKPEAMRCPHCGSRIYKKSYLIAEMIVVLVLIILFWLFGKSLIQAFISHMMQFPTS